MVAKLVWSHCSLDGSDNNPECYHDQHGRQRSLIQPRYVQTDAEKKQKRNWNEESHTVSKVVKALKKKRQCGPVQSQCGDPIDIPELLRGLHPPVSTFECTIAQRENNCQIEHPTNDG